MLVNIIQNTISSFRSALAAAEVITTNLKMWLGFETSETLGGELQTNDFSVDTTGWGFQSATLSVSNNELINTSNGVNNYGIALFSAPLENSKSYVVEGYYRNIDATNAYIAFFDGASQTTIAAANASTTNVYFKVTITSASSGNPALKFNSTSTVGQNLSVAFSNISVKEVTQITPDKSGNNNVGELFTGKALDFSGSTDKVDFDFTTPVKSAVFWVKPLGTGLENILTFGGAFAGTKSIRSNSNVISSLGLSSVSVYVNGVQSSSVPLNQWSRVVVNFASVTPSELKFGFAFNSYGNIQLSDVQLYNENLSTDDIAYDYANPQNLVTDRDGTSIGLSNLKGYWHLSEGAGSLVYDSSGEGNNGTINGATYEVAQPRIPQLGMMNWAKSTPVADEVTLIPSPNNTSQDILGNAVRDRLNSFNLDVSGYAEVADDADLDFGTGDFTLECWAKYDFLNQGRGFNVLVSNGSMSSSGSGLSLGSSITKFEVRLNAGTAITKSFGTDNMTVGNWYHLVVTREGTRLKTYRDTTIKSSSIIASVNVDTSLPVRIGRDTTTARFYQNLISDVRLYDRALSSDEVENNYNAGLSAHTND